MRQARHHPSAGARAGLALALVTLLSGAPQAAAQDLPVAPPGNDATLRDTPAVNSARVQPVPGSRGAIEGDLGEHQMTGIVQSVDQADGVLVVDVKGKDVRVLFPATALSRLAKGDQVTLTVAVQKLATDAP